MYTFQTLLREQCYKYQVRSHTRSRSYQYVLHGATLMKLLIKLIQLIKSLIKLIKRLNKSLIQFIKSLVCLLRALLRALLSLIRALDRTSTFLGGYFY